MSIYKLKLIIDHGNVTESVKFKKQYNTIVISVTLAVDLEKYQAKL